MKKILSLVIGASLLTGTVAFAKEKSTAKKTTKGTRQQDKMTSSGNKQKTKMTSASQ